MSFGKQSPKNPQIRSGSDVRNKKVLELAEITETPKQRRASRKSAAKNLFPEARVKKSDDVFDPESGDMDSPVIKFAGSRRAFNTTTQAQLEIAHLGVRILR